MSEPHNAQPLQERLSALQVAVLLVSASYGIGFLFGSGEIALQWGMAGSIYALVTSLGIALLAITAPRLWRSSQQIWDVMGQAYGPRVKTLVAGLSVVWMGGILAAQLQGGVAVLRLMHLPPLQAYAGLILLIFFVCGLRLGLATRIFSVCLAASSALLLYALFAVDGLPVFVNALPAFTDGLNLVPATRLWVILLAIAPLVVTGADYQQFVIAADSRRSALAGCSMAACFLLVIGFLPASVVIAYENQTGMPQPQLGNQIMPFIMARVANQLAAGYDWIVLLTLLTAAVGSATAIVRAIGPALLSLSGHPLPLGLINAVVLIGAGLIAARGQSIIGTMVALNMVYIGAVCVVFVAMFTRWSLSPQCAWSTMLAGFTGSLAGYIIGWGDWFAADADLLSLLGGLALSCTNLLWCIASGQLRQRL